MQVSNAKWFKPTNLSSGRLRQDGCHHFNASLDYVVFPTSLEQVHNLEILFLLNIGQTLLLCILAC